MRFTSGHHHTFRPPSNRISSAVPPPPRPAVPSATMHRAQVPEDGMKAQTLHVTEAPRGWDTSHGADETSEGIGRAKLAKATVT